MKFFIDTASVSDIREAAELGLLDGVTTNPTLLSKEEGDPREILRQITKIVEGPVSAEVTALDAEGMVREALELRKIGDNIVVKIPMTLEGLRALRTLSRQGVPTNCTLIFHAAQALMAAKAGATYASPFVGRLDDIAQEGMDMVRELAAVLEIQGLEAEIIVASSRSPRHVIDGAIAGAHIATVPFKVVQQMIRHPLTDKGIAQFEADWAKAQAELATKS